MALVGMPSGTFEGEDLRQLADRDKRRLALARDLAPDRHHASDRPIELKISSNGDAFIYLLKGDT